MYSLKRNIITKTLLAVSCLGVVTPSMAAISLDRTRAIFNGDDKSMTLTIANDNKLLPYLAQAWLENGDMEKITTGPLIVTPPVQRVEPGKKSLVRIASTPGIEALPQDKESLFYFNLREVPPKSEKANVLQIALQTKIKLFYRPASIEAKPNAIWQDQLVLNETPAGYQVENPTPYYITVTGIAGSKSVLDKGEFEPFMIAPKSQLNVKSKHYSAPLISYINDYGGRPVMTYQCENTRCTIDKSKEIQ
ncbi:fimbrial biogenesis chaperone [Carnobacterium maltaromaticum]|uniref:fimbrial biogenesis chaperone n=1 Tax=Carnobacterium maltaromaticum TaxID=2751 RepID=UPI000C7775F8|nr:molecular chaperone [Carnobacterium maltaromaticum]